MDESILNDVKKMLGLMEDDNSFDVDIINHINTSLMILNQIGVGISNFQITGPYETWNNFLNDRDDLKAVKTYVAQKVGLVFDTPLSSIVTNQMKENISELEWRLNVASENGKEY